MAQHRPALLRKPGHVDDAAALAVEMRRHAEHRPDGDDAGAADPGDDDAVGMLADFRELRLRQGRQVLVFGDALALLELRAVDGDEGGAETFEAAKVLVAAGLIDAALAPELGLERLHRDAIRLHAAIPAALAHELVDDHALLGSRIEPALAAPAILRRAGLIVDQHARARHGGEVPLHPHQLVAVMHVDAPRPIDVRGIFPRLVGDDDQALDTGGSDLAGGVPPRAPPPPLL